MLSSSPFKLALLAGAAGSSLAIASTAHAQTAPADASTAGTSNADIVVTGSRVVRDGFQAPTPLTVLTQEEIENTSPSNNIADFVNQMPALAGSTRPANSRLNLSSGQAGINALNLRNLGETRTLILLDGRRAVPSTITGLVDVNTLPQALIERVDIVTGGASAAYGSDAVAGVVNFILDKDYTGIKLEADTGITTYGDGFNYSASLAGGTSFADGRGHVLISGEIAHRDGIFEVDRDWNHTGFVRITNPAYNATTNSSVPQFLIRTQVGAANSTPGGLITGSAGGTANSLRGLYFGAGGAISQYQYGALTFPSPTGSAAPTLTQGGDWRVNDSGRRIGLDPEDDRYGVFGRLSFDVTDSVRLFAEGAYNRQEVFFNAGPNLSTGITIRPDNAYLIRAFANAGRSLAGITSVTLATTAADLPFRAVNNRRRVQRYTIGAEGDFDMFGNAAVWDVYAQYGRAKMREQLRNIMNTQRMLNATDAVFSVAGNTSSPIVCRINVDTDPNNNDPACVPLNRMGLGVADPAAIAYVLGDPYRDQTITQKVAGANLSLTPFATWAGDVSVAVGAEYREESIKGSVPEEFRPIVTQNGTSNRWSVGNYLPSVGSYDVKEAYLETVVPLGFGLEFNGAVRATDYSTSGYVTTWKAGATWQPIEDIRLRVTRSRDIRAPNLAELYQAGTANSDSVRNPFFPGSGPLGNTYPASISYSGLVTGNPNLKPEKADSWNIGGVISPRFIPGLSVSADYFRIDLDDAIDTISAQEIVNRCFDGRTEYCDAITADPTNSTRVLIRSQPFNFANRLVRGIDFDASYRRPLGTLFGAEGATLALRGIATRYIENRVDTGIPGTVAINTVGSNGGQYSTPKWIYRFSAGIDTDSFSITGVGRGVSKGRYAASGIECQTNCPVSTTQFPTYDNNRVSGTFYVDLNTTFKFDGFEEDGGEFFVNVTNLFDADPIILPETGLAANSTYSDLLGRTFRVGVRLKLR
ncbi:TonB-dependent receptor [Altererythrobacter aerius]|uniref:TonB-dependent receptor n=1 Tax=Tsuneonella aeria TaxID=1837929 RepID=A0A6I4THA2_9SPHN|nr:TonB-dependent receptor [Tsuneonella aeria]MXO76027.1 TonB-dependent receptor [Tsuneonella aeria]